MIYRNDRPVTDVASDVLGLDGYLAPSVPVRSVLPAANAPGLWGSSVTVVPRTIALTVGLRADSLAARTTALDALHRWAVGVGTLWTADAPDRELWVECAGVAPRFYDQAFTHREIAVTLVFVSPDPTRYAREALPFSLSTARTPLSIGTAACAPRLWLYGACVDPVVILRNAQGTETHRLTLAGTLLATDALVIDSATQSIERYVSGVLQTGTAAGDAWLASGAFPVLDPLDSIGGAGITVELSSASGTPTGLLLLTRAY